MKIYEVTLFILVFHIAIAMVNVSGAFAGYERAADSEFYSSYTTSIDGYNFTQSPVSDQNSFESALGSIYQGGLFFVRLGLSSVLINQAIANILGGSSEAVQFGNLIGFIVGFLYAAAIAQYWVNRSFKSYE